MKSFKNILGVFAASAVGTTAAQAQWTMLDTFEGQESDLSTNDFAGWSFYQELSIENEVAPIIAIDPDPAGGDNSVFYYDPQGYGSVWNVSTAMIGLPDPVAEGEVATLYFRMYVTGYGVDINVGLSAVPVVDRDPATHEMIVADGGGEVPLAAEPTQSPANFEAQVNFFSISGDATPVGRSGSGWGFSEYEVPLNQWVEVWLVTDNGSDMTDVYMRAEGESEATAVFPEPLAFRNGTEEALATLIINYNAGDPAAPFAGDAVYSTMSRSM